MNKKIHNITIKSIAGLIMVVAAMILVSPRVYAFTLEKYAQNSVLSEGKWVKVSVTETGMHLITTADLKKWGFSDPSKVKVYGYGGRRISDKLVSANYIDDLPQVASVHTSRGLMFYGVGPVTWSTKSSHFVHSLNPFSTVGYYFLSDKEAEPCEIPVVGRPSVTDESSLSETFVDRVFHEKDLMSAGETGHMLLGEDFKYSTNQNFVFETPDNQGETVWMRCSFVTKTYASTSLRFTANGVEQEYSPSDIVKASSNTPYTHCSEGVIEKNLNVTGDKITLGVSYNSSVTVHLARLNYLTLNYNRLMKMRDGKLDFRASATAQKLRGATSETRVWDVTNPLEIKEMDKAVSGDAVIWTNAYTGRREYTAWDENGTFPSPTYEGMVANQNLHALEVPDMVIFTIGQWHAQAERIADLHRNSIDSLEVLVINQDEVFNEFSSGTRDVNSFRKMLKMFWDRGIDGAGGHKLKYALFMGRGSFDNRQLTPEVQALDFPMMPTWQSEGGFSDNDSYSTDDIFAFLSDGSGSNISADKLNIAVGRMPVRSVDEAKAVVDKLYKYVNSSLSDSWKNQMLLIADDDDNGAHMLQTESLYNEMLKSPSGGQFFYNKLFLDSYVKTNNQYPEAHEQMMRMLREGVMFLSYIGHANTSSWSHEGLLTYEDICNLYYKRIPVVYAATCEFMRWDAVAVSGGEIMFKTDNGGVIAMISACRPVFIADNGTLTNYLGSKLLERDKDGNFMPIGEILRRAKNVFAETNKSNSNKLRYALMGDPAMRFTTPTNVVALETIDGKPVNFDDQVTIMANQDVTLTGAVYDAKGNRMSDFNGMIEATLFDAERSVTTLGQGDNGLEVTYEEQGGRLFAVRDSVNGGGFTIKVAMPSEIASNFRPAALNLFAVSNDKQEAIGCNRDFYVYGFDETAQADTIAPTIEYYYLNHETFKSGDVVNESPMVIAHVSDNRGINLSTAGIGHQITLTLDGVETFNDVSLYYTPDASDTSGGVIMFPLSDLTEGVHTLRLRVWDTSGNATEETIEFVVKMGLAPRVYDVYTDVNPASTEANFYLTHNRPDQMITVKVGVYDLLGKEVWSETRSGRSDMFTSFPFNWNLCDNAGRRVLRGIYVYRASISTDGENFATDSKRIAVTAP